MKKIFIAFLTIILIDLLSLLIVNCTLKDIIVKDILIESIKSDKFKLPVYQDDSSKENIMNNDVIYEIMKSDEITESLNEFIDETITNLSEEDSKDLNVDMFKDDVIKYMRDNKSELSEATGVEITDEMIDEASKELDNQDTKNIINQQIKNTKNNLSEKERSYLKTYKFIISTKLRIIIIASIITIILLIILITKSPYKWINNLSYSMIISGAGSLLMAYGIKYIIKSVLSFEVNLKSVITVALIITIFGLIMKIIYVIFTKVFIKGDKNAVS